MERAKSDHGRVPRGVRSIDDRGATARPLLRASCPLCQMMTEPRSAGGSAELVCAHCGMRFRWDSAGSRPSTTGGCAAARGTLDHWLAGEPIRPASRTNRQRLAQWCRKHPGTATLLGTAIALLLLAAVLGPVGYSAATAHLRHVDRARHNAESERRAAERRAEDQARLAVERRREWEAAVQRAEALLAAQETAEQRLREMESSRVRAEQERLAAEQRQFGAARQARIALARQLADDSQYLLPSHPLQSLLLAGESLHAEIQEGMPPNQSTEQVLRDAMAMVGPRGFEGHEGPILQTAISPDGRWLATAGTDGTIRLWNLRAEQPGAEPFVLRRHRNPVTALAMSPDGHWLASAGFDGSAFLWRLTAKEPAESPLEFRSRSGRIYAMLLSPDRRWLVTAGGIAGGESSVAELWDLAAERPAARSIELRGHERPILAVAVAHDGRRLATAGKDKTIRVWNLASRHPAAEQVVLRGHEGWIGTLAVSPDGQWLASGSYDGTARLWRLDPPDPAAAPVVLRGHEGWVGTVAFSPDGRWLATGGFDRTVRLWQFQAGQIDRSPRVLAGHEGRIETLAFTPDSRRLISGSFDATVRLWDLATAEPEASPSILRGHAGPINTISVSPDGRWLVSGAGETFDRHDNTARLWDIGVETLLENARLVTARRLAPAARERILLNAAAGEATQPAYHDEPGSPAEPAGPRLRIVLE